MYQFEYQTGLFVFNTVLEKQIKAVIYFWGEPKEGLSELASRIYVS